MSRTPIDNTLDVRFFRLTGVTLVVATLVAGAMTLSLTIGESRALYLAQEAQTTIPLQLAASLDSTSPTE